MEEEVLPIKEPLEVPITELFGIKFSQQLDIYTFLWIGLALILLYLCKGLIDFIFAYFLKKVK